MAKATTTLSPRIPTIYSATGAACWASYLINGDVNSITDEERQLADTWYEQKIGNCVIVDCSKPYLSRYGNVIDYHVIGWV